MPTAKMTSKGQITIPVEMRKKLGLKPGVRIDFYETEDGVWALRARNGSILDLKGCLPKLDHVVTVEEMDEAIGEYVAAEYLRSVSSEDSEQREDGEAA